GMNWTTISPDLTLPNNRAPLPTANAQEQPVRNAIESISASSVAPGTIWVGTNNGLIQVTRDNGKTWDDVTIPGLPNPSRADVMAIDASHQNAATAYAAVDLHTTGDYTPYLYRTHDYGKTWTRIVNGLATSQPSGSFARVIRTDPEKAGLLFAGTESSMYVSFDDGDHWQSLMLNLPNTSYRDITFHGNDLIVGTYVRGIWILDSYAVLRQLTPALPDERVHLFAPAEAVRVRRNVNADTPFPPEVPHALNPPDGAITYYSLASKPAADMALDVMDASGTVVRHMSSAPSATVPEATHPPEPNFWLAPPMSLPTNIGINRANWDLRYDSPPAFVHSFEINANPGQTPPSPEGPLALPGVYTLKLTVAGKSYVQQVTVVNDPRSPATMAELRAQNALLMKLFDGAAESWGGYNQVTAMRHRVAEYTHGSAPSDVVAAATSLDAKLAALSGTVGQRGPGGFSGAGGTPPPPNFVAINGAMNAQLAALDNGDMAPSVASIAGYNAECSKLKSAVTSWGTINATDVAAFNTILAKNNVKPIRSASPGLPVPMCGGLSR
ncbi:MAG: WD40/YVTN/BNR-like repeat-containing protein, partial [Gemmatimonadaceae bacterium]